MTRRGWILSALAGLLVAGGLVWPGMALAQAIKVGAVVPLTGRYAAPGGQVRAGYEIAIEDVNRGWGVTVGGKKVPLELVLLDDESDATKTVARYETLAAQGDLRDPVHHDRAALPRRAHRGHHPVPGLPEGPAAHG
jgi:ABC-type branched-subunit amino acid transport system substrate-binding protein